MTSGISGTSPQSFKEVAAKYPDVPSFVIRKIDVGLRGVTPTDRAVERARQSGALFEEQVEGGGKRIKMGGGTFRDGSALFGLEASLIGPGFGWSRMLRGELVPYVLDVLDDELMLVDGDGPAEQVYLATIPDYYGKRTSRGTPMHHLVTADPPDCLNISPHNYCRFWREKQPCKYCTLGAQPKGEHSSVYHSHNDINQGHKTQDDLEDIYEAVSEALKEPGRWTCIRLIAGSDPAGTTPFENEVDQYIAVLKTLRRCFDGKGPSVRLVASALPESQLVRLKETGATAYMAPLEVWDEKLFQWVCPSKAKYFGRQYWIDSAIAAIKVFGRGNVSTQWVGGAEMTRPYGFQTVDEAVASTLEGTEFFAQHGVTASFGVLRVLEGSIFYGQKQAQPSLEYSVRLAAGMRDIRRKHGLGVDHNDFRRCGKNPDTEMSRLDYPDIVT